MDQEIRRETTNTPEVIEYKKGVGALIVTPEGYFLSIEEGSTKRETAKIKGMRSLPMETVEPGETREQALIRALTDEEVKVGISLNLEARRLLCRIQLTPGVWLYAYLIEAPEQFPVQKGNAPDALNPGWNHINQVLNSIPTDRNFRPGVREVIKSYLEYLRGNTYQPQIFFFCEDEIPQEVFDRVERLEKERVKTLSLFQHPLPQQP